MLLQSHTGELVLLPALPKNWPHGAVRGLRARGGFEVDVAWQQGKLKTASLKSLLGNRTVVRYETETRNVTVKAGEVYVWR